LNAEESKGKNKIEPWMLAEARRAILKHLKKVSEE
jgi:DNA-binding transcriptional ArsR family regulator